MLRNTFLPFFLLVTLLLAACQPTNSAVSSPQAQPTTVEQHTFTATAIIPTDTQTPAPTLTPTSTTEPTAAPTDTPTATVTPTPQPNLALPGIYLPASNACQRLNWPYYKAVINFCIDKVIVDVNWHVNVFASWNCTELGKSVIIHKINDKANRNLFLMDNFGNRYDPIYVGGYLPGFSGPGTLNGWFEFGPLAYGTTSLTFNDEMKFEFSRLLTYGSETVAEQIRIGNIQVAAPDVLFAEMPSPAYPLTLLYQPQVWRAETVEGVTTLVNNDLADCTIQELAPGLDTGSVINQATFGEVEYQVLKAAAEGTSRYRVYRATKIPFITEDIRPAYKIRIPDSDQLVVCIDAVGDVLRSLQNPLPEMYFLLKKP